MQNIIGQPKSNLDTPCLVLDKKLLQANIQTMQQQVNSANKQLRPHVKTHKCIKICELQMQQGAVGIAAAKVSEALVLAEHGFKNTLITSPVVTPAKIAKLLQCLHLDPNLILVLDNYENAVALNSILESHNQRLNILIDIDPDVGRTGISFEDAVEFSQALLPLKQLRIKGIQCYAGNLQHIQNYQQRQKASMEKMQQAAKVSQQLRDTGIACEIVSGSGTGTYAIDMHIAEVTEVQPGSYTVMDAEYQEIENSLQDIKFKPALTLLTSIISVNHGLQVTCDAGWKALYQSETKPLILQPSGYEYNWFGDEHGKITSAKNAKLLRLGDRLEMMVAHCDPTINLYDEFYIVEDGIVVDVWPIEMRGKSQ